MPSSESIQIAKRVFAELGYPVKTEDPAAAAALLHKLPSTLMDSGLGQRLQVFRDKVAVLRALAGAANAVQIKERLQEIATTYGLCRTPVDAAQVKEIIETVTPPPIVTEKIKAEAKAKAKPQAPVLKAKTSPAKPAAGKTMNGTGGFPGDRPLDPVDNAADAASRPDEWASDKPQAPVDVAAAFTFLGDAPATPPRELIKDLIPAFGVCVTGGQSSAGKTFIEIHKAVCLANGLPFFGRRIVERVGTVFIAAEGRALIPNRFAAALVHNAITRKLPISWIKQLPDFSSLEGIKRLQLQLKEMDKRYQGDFGVRLGQVTIDTLAACFSMRSEDDNAEATKISNICRTIGETIGAVIAPVHHYGKNPESGLRGASAWKGSADGVMGVLADIDPLSGRASNREVVCTKARDGEQGPLSAFDLEFVQLGLNADDEPYGSVVVIPSEGKSRFDKGGMSKSQRAIQNAIDEAMDSSGKYIAPRAGMTAVKAVKVTDVRQEFDRRYVVDEAEPAKAANNKRMAFKRSLDRLSASKFGAGSAEGADWIWKIT